MLEKDFTKNAPGELLLSDGPTGPYLAYSPYPLPPKIRFDPLVRLLSEADQALGELKGIGRMLPNPHLLIRPFLSREAVASSRIEGTVTNLEELFIFEASARQDENFPDRQEVANYVKAVQYGLNRLQTLPVSLRLIREVHSHLMMGVRGEDKTPGEFRKRQNMIAKPGQTPAEARVVPPPVPEMGLALDKLEAFMAHPSGLPTLVDLALIHYQFETIHPFLDGNGRLGRALITLLLYERGCLTQPLLYLSAFLEENREEYLDQMLKVSQRGTWGEWIAFFLRAIAIQAVASTARCNELLELWAKYKVVAQKLSSSTQILRLVDSLFENPAMTIKWVEAILELSFSAAQANIEKLVGAGILREVTGQSRNRVYVASEIISVLNRG